MTAPEGPLVIGVDSSTQSTKALVVDAATGDVVARGQAPHTVSPGDRRESDPEEWWQALRTAVGQCGRAASEAAAVSVAGQQHGLVTLDAEGRPVREALLWNDVRSAPQRDRLVAALGGPKAWAERVGSVPAPAFTVTKWAWLREHEPEAARAATAVRLPHDFLTERLTGRGATDRGDASGTGWWSAATESYDEEILELAGLDPALLPPVLGAGEAAGTVREADDGFLTPGTLVATGTGDNMAAALGLGLVPGQAVLSLGTSGTVYTVSTRRPADPTGTVAGFADARTGWLPLACTLNCTLAVDRIAALLSRDREDVEAGGHVTALPFLDGERTPHLPYATGLLTGLQHATTGGQVLQAAYDGAVFTLLRALDLVLAETGEGPGDTPLLLIGGGAKGVAWRETVRRLSGRAVQVPAAGELVALGAAAQAAGLLLGEDPAAVARRWRTAEGPSYEPVARDEEALDRLSAALDGAQPLLGRRS
ncbi:xylulokinase [Streptomyces albus]|uniref:Xylulose kinase n=1 Tax=Streptomyces albus TaxID=1888 RepID=A0A6C1CF12_9ACTN|nr:MULTISPECIES: xylulokinase [Streptomyces]KPC90235.1 xylulose kinase [Streptomyces sp. NRRL F-6602]EPD91556.1 xylulose kinase [Streptomyces sp. HPH0547]QID39476.1 xylulokinase [Streptomyces albus]TGG86208.1 xylulokinase [Streptomyces albus]UVN53465.1 xylulokinase [Streptomyces albus]